ncbi:MAG: V-type ATP synthase subunit E [Candidatus Omnitrophota bacterium]
MALADITGKIQSDARLQSEHIIKEAKAKAREITEAAKAKSNLDKEEIIKKAQRECARKLKSTEISLAILVKNAILREKQDIVEEVFTEAKRILSNLDANEYRRLIRNMLISAIGKGDEEIIFSRNDRDRLDESFLHMVNEGLVAAGKKPGLRIVHSGDFEGGFVVKMEKIHIDGTFHALLKVSRSELQGAIATILFA